MSWLFLAAGTAPVLFVLVFWISDDEPLTVRLLSALAFAVLWLPLLILFAAFMLADAIVALIKQLRK